MATAQIDQRLLIGNMDLDSPAEAILPGYHRTARNVEFRGPRGNKRPQNVMGSAEIDNNLLPGTGTNLNIGRYVDSVRRRIYFFNFNSAGSHGIYVFDISASTFYRLVEVGVNTEGDVLGFAPSPYLCHVSIMYGDNAQGDFLYWLNSQGVPCKINVKTALSFGFHVYSSSELDVAKEPVVRTPSVVYEDDPSVTVNNLRKRVFKFKLRYVFDDNEKPVTSIQSEIPLPYWPFNTDVDADPSKNSRIAVVYETGPENVKKVEILAAVNIGNQFSDFFLVEAIDKSANSIPDNDIAVYNFYNDKAYDYISVEESIQLFDYVPQRAGAQEILNGNVPIYGNITEGYPNLTYFSNGFIESSINSGSVLVPDGVYFSSLNASQSGKQAFGDGPVHVIVKGRVTALNLYRVKFTDLSFIEYTAVGGDDIEDVMQGLIDDAIAKGFTVTGTAADPDFVFFRKTGYVLAGTTITTPDQNQLNVLYGSINAYDWWSRVSFGLVYFDAKGRTNGVVTTTGFSVETVGYSEGFANAANIPYLNIAIYHRPPEWAVYYSIVRTKNLTKSKFVQWISVKTLKETTSVPFGMSSYAYISLESLNLFKSKNPQSPLSYSFAPNDRIRFIKRFTASGGTANIYADKDFEIVSQEINPTVNGVTYPGQYVKILLPTTDASFDFGTSDFDFYFIELYTPAQPVANDLNVYYEFGERYLIGDAGLPTRFHQGGFQNQTPDLVSAAVIDLVKGDNYLRDRFVQLGTEITYEIQAGFGADSDAGRVTLGCAFIDQDINDPEIIPGTSPLDNLIGFDLATNNTRQILTIGTGTYQFLIEGTISITFPDIGPDEYPYEFFLQKNDGTKIQLVPVFDAHNPDTYVFQVNTTFSMSSGERLFIFGWSVFGNDNTRSFNTTNLTITRVLTFQQTMIDPNFSDYYPSAVNSNGRPFVSDPDADTVTYPVLYRWGLAFQPDTNINQSNRFYPLNFDSADRSCGAIMRLRYFDKILRIFQERKCGWTGVYQRFISNADGQQQLITTNEIITPNNINYYIGEYGVGNQPDSIVSDGFRDYFFDPIKSMLCRLSADGVESISETFFTQTFAGSKGPAYQSNNLYRYGGISRITGTLNVRKDNVVEYISLFQSSVGGMAAEALSFSEDQKGFMSFYDYDFDAILCAENALYSFKAGRLYRHTNSVEYNTFAGFTYAPSVTVVFNNVEAMNKVYMTTGHQGNQKWVSPVNGDVFTSFVNPQTGLVQISQLQSADYKITNNTRYADFLRDVNSMSDPVIALLEGDFLIGNYISVKFEYQGTAFAFMYAPYITWIPNGKNP